MDTIAIVARFVGAFYIFGGFIALRLMRMDKLLDAAISAIDLKPVHPRERVRRIMLSLGGILTGLSGVALLTLSLWAVPLFIVSLAAQAAWLLWARTNYAPENAGEARGRRQTTNAAIIYAVVTAAVVWLGASGVLAGWAEPLPLLALGFAIISGLVWFALGLRPGKRMALDEGFDQDAYVPEDPDANAWQPARILVSPRIGGFTLFDADTGEPIYPYQILEADFAYRVDLWEESYQAACDPDLTDSPAFFKSEAEALAFRAEGDAIVAELRLIYGRDNVEGPIYEQRIVPQ